ncbi:MAG: hypothetical protein KJ674_00485 [Nanoarchaeota archaeon]|nr:hypothetical protein [Nanoarchaeota archaeon]
MSQKKIMQYFAEGGKANCQDSIMATEEGWSEIGLKIFKRKVLGRFGSRRTISTNDLEKILIDMKFVERDEAKEFVQRIYNKKINCGNAYFLNFIQTQNKSGEEYCIIQGGRNYHGYGY